MSLEGDYPAAHLSLLEPLCPDGLNHKTSYIIFITLLNSTTMCTMSTWHPLMWSWYSLADSIDNSLAVDSVMWHVYKKGIGDVCIPVKPVDCEVWCGVLFTLWCVCFTLKLCVCSLYL